MEVLSPDTSLESNLPVFYQIRRLCKSARFELEYAGMSKVLLVLTILSTLSLPAFAETDWFPKGAELFPMLLADPEDVHTSAQFFRHNGLDTVDMSVGNIWGMKRWKAGKKKDVKVQWDISGAVQPRFLISLNVNQLEAIDFFINSVWEIRRGVYSARVTLYHESAHLGDNFIERTGRPRISYSREGVQALLAVEPRRWIRLYGGGTTLLHRIPEVPRTELQAGLEMRGPNVRFMLPDHECWFYLASDAQSRDENQWNVNSNTQVGLHIGFKDVARSLRIYGNYFTGHSNFGQFFTEKEDILGVGFSFDF